MIAAPLPQPDPIIFEVPGAFMQKIDPKLSSNTLLRDSVGEKRLKAVDDLFEREVNEAANKEVDSSSEEESSEISAPKNHILIEQVMKEAEEEVKNDGISAE
jgi:hypothetical protein